MDRGTHQTVNTTCTGPVPDRPRPEYEAPGTRSRLLSAATFDFARRGFHGTSLRAVAKRAGKSLGCVRYHFGGKEGLYRAVLAEGLVQLRAVVTPPPPGGDVLWQTLVGLTGVMSAEPHTARLFLRATLDSPDTMGGEVRALVDDLAKVIAGPGGERATTAGHPHVLAVQCLCTAAAAVLLPAKDEGLPSVDPEPLALYLCELVRS